MSSSRSERHSAQRAFRRLPLLVIALLLMIVPPTVAWAGQINYASGTNGVGGTFPTSGEAVRSYNQVCTSRGTTGGSGTCTAPRRRGSCTTTRTRRSTRVEAARSRTRSARTKTTTLA